MSGGLRHILSAFILLGAAPAGPARAMPQAEACKSACLSIPRQDRAGLAACFARCNAATPAATRPAGGGFGQRAALQQPAPAAAWGVIYAAPPPSGGIGVVAGRGDRLGTHGRAESACAAQAQGLPCRMLVEFAAGCAAAAQARLGNRVAVTTAETGPTRQAAEAAALGACRTRSPDICRVVQAACLE